MFPEKLTADKRTTLENSLREFHQKIPKVPQKKTQNVHRYLPIKVIFVRGVHCSADMIEFR